MTKDKNVNISINKILQIWGTLFELIEIEVQSCKNYFKILLPQEAGVYGNNVEKEMQKSHTQN